MCQDVGRVTTVRNPSIPTCMCQQLFNILRFVSLLCSATEFCVVGMVVPGSCSRAAENQPSNMCFADR